MGKHNQIISWAARAVLAGVFAFASVAKIARPAEFYVAVMNYQILPQRAAFAAAYFLPALELMCAIALLSKIFFRPSTCIICLMLFVFIVAIISAWIRGLNISCGCFGGDGGTGEYLEVIIRDIVLLGLCAVIFLLNSKEHLN